MLYKTPNLLFNSDQKCEKPTILLSAKNQCQPSKEQVVALLLLGDDLRQAKLSRERYKLLINQVTQLVCSYALGLTNLQSRGSDANMTLCSRKPVASPRDTLWCGRGCRRSLCA